MSQHDYLPASDEGLRTFCQNFSTLINQTPTAYKLTADIATAYEVLFNDYDGLLQSSKDPSSRGERSIFLKNGAKKALAKRTRELAMQINNDLGITDAQRQELGLTIRSSHRTPSPVPQQKPFVLVTSVDGRSVTIELRKDASTRGKPEGCVGATILTADSPTTPAADWRFVTNTTKTKTTIQFPASETGNTVYVSAFWTNRKDESGPAATPVAINLPAGGMMIAKARNTPTLKVAA